MFEHIEAVIFDFDGTLVNLLIDFRRMREEIIELVGRYLELRKKFLKLYVLELIEEVYKRIGKESPGKAKEFLQRALGIVREIELEAAEEAALLPGIEEAFENLKKNGLKIGIITRNCSEAVKLILDRTDLVYDVLLTRDEVNKVKPHPAHLREALRRLGTKPENTIMVGDHPLDIVAGKRVGLKTVAVLTGSAGRKDLEGVGADLILNKASELARYL